MKLRGIHLWSFALYTQSEPFSIATKLIQPCKIFNSRRIRTTKRHPHTQADPFLCVADNSLHIFYERVVPRGKGEIACFRTTDLEHFEDLGLVLTEAFHLSYPFVFSDAGDTFMLPEAQHSGEVPLYRFTRFPNRLEKFRTLLHEPLADPFIVREGSLWYLFGTSSRGLEIFVSSDLRSGKFEPHPQNPVTTDPRYSRSGGGPLIIAGELVRVSQDCSETYGENVSLIAVHELTPTTYREEVVVPRFFSHAESWNKDGAHHLSVARFRGTTVVAADGKHRDYLINKLLYRFYR